jgi:hypothetical protein
LLPFALTLTPALDLTRHELANGCERCKQVSRISLILLFRSTANFNGERLTTRFCHLIVLPFTAPFMGSPFAFHVTCSNRCQACNLAPAGLFGAHESGEQSSANRRATCRRANRKRERIGFEEALRSAARLELLSCGFGARGLFGPGFHRYGKSLPAAILLSLRPRRSQTRALRSSCQFARRCSAFSKTMLAKLSMTSRVPPALSTKASSAF